ncbi:hypothetical protein V494_06091 [Pseudogymnoascus sp. VKM F-4513 (FW-928)]|nr:hypothetical protein V494_06091 [Pseudogymnoascus sp. VKM F-4513 (FW-928)]
MDNGHIRDMANQERVGDEIQSIHILHLPMDVLSGIFDCLRNDRNVTSPCDLDVKTIQSARLVCSLFNYLASPLLCPVVTVNLDQASLDRAGEISRTPLIAAGVREIDVELNYRPKELADDFVRYKNQRQKDLDGWIRSCEYYADTWHYGGYDENDETVCKQPLRVYNKAMKTYWGMKSAWDNCILSPDVGAMDDDTFRYRQVLWKGHEEYRRKHEEQFKLIADGSFVETLASVISRMGSCTSLRFGDEASSRSGPSPYRNDPTLMSTDPEMLSGLMATSFDWRAIERLDGAELFPAKILSELPIAIHKAGAVMPVIKLACFPTTNNYSMIRPGRNLDWSDLRSASQKLTAVRFKGNSQPIRLRSLLPEEQAPMDDYLSAILSGQNVEDVDLDFYTFKLNDGTGVLHGLHHIGAVFVTANWPRLKRLRMSHASFHQGELETFCRSLDGDRINRVSLYDVELLSGSWAGAIDILREKLALRCLDGKCEVRFDGLRGGEFEKKRIKKSKGHGSIEVQSYVSGVGSLNPLVNKVAVKQWVNPAKAKKAVQ